MLSDPLWAAVEVVAAGHLDDGSPVDQALAFLAGIAEVRAALAVLETQVVGAARAQGATWDEIGDEAGMTRQGARQKWGNLACLDVTASRR